MFAEAIEELLRDHCTPENVRSIESGGPHALLWEKFADAGFLEVLASEAQGGAALPLAELFPIFKLLGHYAAPVPLAQAMAARALVAEQVNLPAGVLTLAPALVWQNGKPVCPRVPYGSVASHVLAADGDRLVLLDAIKARRVSLGIARSQSATLSWNSPDDLQVVQGDAGALAPLACALHAAMMAGAMARVFDVTLRFCNDRQQFGRPLGKFQAIQHQLSVMAEHVAAVSIAAEAAFESKARVPSLLRAAVAKARASEAVPFVADTAHALHGAIGVTEEYDLQLLTRRLREWRWAHGSEAHWHQVVGEAVLASERSVVAFVQSL